MSDFIPKKVNKSKLIVNKSKLLVNSQVAINQLINQKSKQSKQFTLLYKFVSILDNSIYIFYLYIYYIIYRVLFFHFYTENSKLFTLVYFFKFSTNNQIDTKIINKKTVYF